MLQRVRALRLRVVVKPVEAAAPRPEDEDLAPAPAPRTPYVHEVASLAHFRARRPNPPFGGAVRVRARRVGRAAATPLAADGVARLAGEAEALALLCPR
eukprot:1911987-Alexandrium_andersonii.AAC.1